ncbi:MAG: HD domain-containing protein [Lachnospiraceae bacterium]|nr:HD domain-containing protein [Lachnospiraceae bacterium]
MGNSEKRYIKHKHREQFWNTFTELREDPMVRSLQKYPNHRVSNLYDHSSRVALCAYDLSHRFRWDVDGEALAKGAMLHDFYMYRAWGNRGIKYKDHLLGHPMVALENAREHFELTGKEENIITSHMWPLTPWQVPRSKEAFLVQLADKVCAFGEGVLRQTVVKQERYERMAERRNEKAVAAVVRSELRGDRKRKKYISLDRKEA